MHLTSYRLYSDGSGTAVNQNEDTIDGHKQLSLTEALWLGTERERRRVLDTNFIQGLKTGKLDPIKFGVFSFEDVVYCLKTVEALRSASLRAIGDVKEYLIHSIEEYQTYSKSLTELWRVSSPDAVTLGSSLSKYIAYHLKVAHKMEPIYTVVSLVPCERLWPWIGEQIKDSSATFGVYRDWIGDNFTGDGYKDVEKFLNEHEAIIDKEKAKQVYDTCMDGEFGFFNAP